MTNQITFANARLILQDEVVHGAVRIEDGKITGIDRGKAVPKGAHDLEGDYLAPGLVELHTDNLERHLTPRPKVDWPHRPAILAHDREMAATGITTVFDAIRVGSIVSRTARRVHRYARTMADEIRVSRDAGLLRVSHHIHLRAEICSETLIEEFDEFSADDRIGIVSMMDHTPGQRQFTDIAKFTSYVRGKHAMSDEDFVGYIDFLYGLQTTYGAAHEAAIVAAAARLGATLASHDDTTADHVTTSSAHGVRIAEFPTTVVAAEACRGQGIATMMGAPNLIRGASHSGNVSASELAKRDLLDIVSSDYVPAGLLAAAVLLGDLWDDLPRGIATVTHAPAARVGLTDRGRIAQGMRADLIRFGVYRGTAVLHETWCAGRRVS